MLPRENRLSAEFDFRRLRREGRRYGSPFFNFFLISGQKGPGRFGFVVSARVSKRAVRRNHLKRIMRAEVENLLPRVRPGLWGAFWVREAAERAEPQVLRRSVRGILQEAKALL